MTGPWRVISYEKDGKKTPNEQLERCSSFLECDGKVMVKREGEIIINGTTKMDWTKKPKLVDITFTEGEFDGKKALGIYELDNDSMKLCYAPPGRDRPTELSSKPGSHQVLIIFKKQVISEIPATISPEGTKREPKDDRWSDLLLVIGVIGFCCIVWRLGMWLRKLL